MASDTIQVQGGYETKGKTVSKKRMSNYVNSCGSDNSCSVLTVWQPGKRCFRAVIDAETLMRIVQREKMRR